VAVGQRAAPHLAHHHRRLQPLRQLGQFGLRVGSHHAAAGVDHREARPLEQLDRALERNRVRHLRRSGRRHAPNGIDLGDRGEQVVRHLEYHRPRPAGAQCPDRVDDARRDRLGRAHDRVPLAQRCELTRLVGDLVQHAPAAADRLRVDLTADHQHRRRAGVCGGETREGIGHARAGHGHAHADTGARARVAVGHVARGLLVPRDGERDPAVERSNRVDRPVELHARHGVDPVDALGRELRGQCLASGHPHRALPLGRRAPVGRV
jgi:hypothetical protein